MTKDDLKAFTVDAAEALAAVCDKHGVTITKTAGTFGDVTSLRYTLQAAGDDTPDVLRWKRYAAADGFKSDDLGRAIEVNGKVFTIAGMKGSGKVVLKDVAGKTYTTPSAVARRSLGAL